MESRGWWSWPPWLEPAFGKINRWVYAAAVKISSGPEARLATSERHIERHAKRYGVDSGQVTRARAQAAHAMEDLGRVSEAQVLRQQVLDAHRRHLGDEHPYTVDCEWMLVSNLCAQGMYDEARPLMRHVKDVKSRTLGAEHKETLLADRWLRSIEDPGLPHPPKV